jgi:predicted DNA-binding protein (UPF0251 family)
VLLSKAIKYMKKQTKRGTSVALTKDEMAALKQYRKGFVTEVECALSIGIDRNVLNRIMTFGSGSPDSIGKIKSAIGIEAVPAK